MKWPDPFVPNLKEKGITDPRVLAAVAEVPRTAFVPPPFRDQASADSPLPIGCGQTISQPSLVALMTFLLKLEPDHRVLEIGTGSGYQAAILGQLAAEVYTIEYHPDLADRAAKTLASLGYSNVHCRCGDGRDGWPEAAPFQGILITAATAEVPKALWQQLDQGGRLLVPLGRCSTWQTLIRFTLQGEHRSREDVTPVRFVPLL